MSPDAALVLLRFVRFGTAIFLFGSTAYLAGLVPERLRGNIERRLGPALAVAAAFAVAATFLSLPAETAYVADGWSDAFDTGAMADVLFATDVGTAWLAQAFLGALLMLAIFWRGWIPLSVAAGLAALFLASSALTGHATMETGWIGIGHQANDAVHLLCIGAWLGSLPALLLILRSPDRLNTRRDAEVALRRFSRAGHVVVALVLATGAANTLLILKRLPTDRSSPYQALLAAKIALVAGMIALAMANRYVFVPRIGSRPGQALRAVRIATLMEIGLGVVVLGLVAAFGTIDPG